MFIYLVAGFTRLGNRDHSQIASYSIYESRYGEFNPLNFEETHSDLAVGMTTLTGTFTALDPTIGYFRMRLISKNPEASRTDFTVRELLDLEPVSKRSHPNLYFEGSLFEQLRDTSTIVVPRERSRI